MTGDEETVSELVVDCSAVLRLLRKHRPVDGLCPECGVTPDKPCRPYRLARLAAHQIGNADD